MPSDAWIEMNSKIELAGGPRQKVSAISGQKLSSMEIIYNEGVKCIPWLNTIIDCFPRLSRDMELEIVISCFRLKDKEVHCVAPLLVDLFYEVPPPFQRMETAARVLAFINARSSYDAVLKLCANKNFGPTRFDLLVVLGRLKSIEAVEVLTRFLDPVYAGYLPPGYVWHQMFVMPGDIGVAKAMRALAITKSSEALRILNETQVPEGLMAEREESIAKLKRSMGHERPSYNPAAGVRRRRR